MPTLQRIRRKLLDEKPLLAMDWEFLTKPEFSEYIGKQPFYVVKNSFDSGRVVSGGLKLLSKEEVLSLPHPAGICVQLTETGIINGQFLFFGAMCYQVLELTVLLATLHEKRPIVLPFAAMGVSAGSNNQMEIAVDDSLVNQIEAHEPRLAELSLNSIWIFQFLLTFIRDDKIPRKSLSYQDGRKTYYYTEVNAHNQPSAYMARGVFNESGLH